jgi:hypothetical protein
MSTSAKTLTPEQQAALAKLQSFTQQKALDDYLSGRATQYGTTPKGAKSDTGWTAGEALVNPFVGLKQEQEYAVIGEGKRYTPRLQYDEYGGTKQGYIDSEGKFVEGALPEGLMKGMETPAGDYDASEYYYEPIRSDKLTDVDVDWKGALGKTFSEQLGHKSTFTKAYSTTEKDAKGNPVEVTAPSVADIQSGKVAFLVGGKTGGESRERMAQMYLPMGDKLIPVGNPSYYKGEHPDAKNVANALKIAAIASLPFGGIGGLLGNVTGGIAGGIASLGIPQVVANIGANALASGVVQGGLSKAMGGDFSKGFKSGAISGGIGAGVGELGAMSGLDKGLGSLYTPAKSIATSALTSAATGRPFDVGQAVKGAAINYGLNQAIGAGGKALNIDPKQQAAMTKFLNFAAPLIAARRKPGGP